MSRLPPLSPELLSGGAKELLEGVGRKLGMVPNMMRTMANSSAALDGYLQLNSALARGVLSAKVREQIALAVAEDQKLKEAEKNLAQSQPHDPNVVPASAKVPDEPPAAENAPGENPSGNVNATNVQPNNYYYNNNSRRRGLFRRRS